MFFNGSSASLSSGPLGGGLITRWQTSMCFISSQTSISSSYQMIVWSFCSQEHTSMRFTLNGRSRDPIVGLIPIGMPSTSTTTTGLRWNLGCHHPYPAWYRLNNRSWCWQRDFLCTDNTSMSYGGLISTSNIVEEDKVTVRSDSDLIWTISLRWIYTKHRVPLSVPTQVSIFSFVFHTKVVYLTFTSREVNIILFSFDVANLI